MTYTDTTIIVTAAVAAAIRKLSQVLDRAHLDGMFTSPLSATGNSPATHFISSGKVPQAFVDAIASADTLDTAARAAWTKNEQGAFPFTKTQVTAALALCTIAAPDEDAFALMARVGVKPLTLP